MARSRGRDVVIDLMDAVAKLEATTTRQADQLEALAAHAVATSAEMIGLSVQVSDVSRRVASLEVEFRALAQGFVESAKLSRTIEQQLGRLARLLGEFAGRSTSRFDDIEGRLEKLERKAG